MPRDAGREFSRTRSAPRRLPRKTQSRPVTRRNNRSGPPGRPTPKTQRSRPIEAQVVAILILLPFALVFIYAGIHEYRRYKSEGRATYGLVYDEETGTTHVTGIGEDEESYDPEDFDPNDHNDREDKNREMDDGT